MALEFTHNVSLIAFSCRKRDLTPEIYLDFSYLLDPSHCIGLGVFLFHQLQFVNPNYYAGILDFHYSLHL